MTTTTEEKKPSNIKAIKDFFGLNAKDKEQLGEGIRNGSLTY